MSRQLLFRLVAIVPLLAFAACDHARDAVAPDAPVPPALLGLSAFTVVDPGAEVNTTIAVTDLQCGETGAVTVTLEGIQPPPEDVPLDLMLTLDESGSISSSAWNQIRTAAIALLDRMDAADGAADQTLDNVRIGVIKFAQNAVYDLPLTGNYETIHTFLLGMTQRAGATNITAALDLSREKLVADGVPGAARAVVFMTDGQATAGNTSPSAQLSAAAAVKNLPARLFVVGVGSSINQSLLNQMASPNSFVLISNFGALAAAFDAIATQALTFPAARDLTFSADVPAGFTLIAGSASASKGTVTESASSVSWSIDVLEAETVTLTYAIQHDEAAEPAGGTLTAVSNGRLTLTTPISGEPFSEDFDDVTAEVVGCDVTPPEITPTVDGALGDNDWYVSDVTVSWTVVDPESPITEMTGCTAQTVDDDTDGVSFTCTATSAGGTASETVTLKRDATPPTVTYSGNAGSYDVTDDVDIMCVADDNLSGLADDTCADVSGAAWTFDVGTNTFNADATDNAGNVGTGSVSFEVIVTFDGLSTLVGEFVANAGVARSLSAKLDAARKAAMRGNEGATRGAINAFIHEVEAQTGKMISADEAAILIALANALI